ncbi:hypothetical protein [Actinoplanes sp. CA-252034]|uniref:hypothetical protein n=1 Tax=Actinoplanes sp. CA-252034 TaxID=3239906 RepID=UPI003D95949C
MTDWEAERVERTAHRSGVVPHGGSPLMPSHSQGAERRPERRAGRTGSRWLLRALVVGGLAGVAWLLTGSAALAADPGATSSGAALGSLPDDVAASAGYEPEVSELLEAAVQSPEPASEESPLVTLDETAGVPPRMSVASPQASGGTVAGRTQAVPSEPVTQGRDLPGDDGLALWWKPGVASGIPAVKPGAHREAGPMAVLPARVAKGAVDRHRFPVAADVEAGRNDAVAPTVSPD